MSTTGSDAPDISEYPQYYHDYKVAVINNLLTGIVYGEG
jgi:hypothetical protein